MVKTEISAMLRDKGLRVTPQRVAIFGAVMQLNNHPSAENIIDYIKLNYPNVAVGTVYKVLDSCVEHGLLDRVKTENGIMRFDPMLKRHHHLYCSKTNKIVDYEDETLDQLISEYFEKKGMKDFQIKDFKLQITGTLK